MIPRFDVLHGRTKLQLSIRGMFLCVAVLSVWLGIYTHRVRTQVAAVQGIRAAGGTVIYESDPEWGAGQRIVRRQFDSSPSVCDDDFFHNVASVEIDERADDAVLEHVGRLTNLEALRMFNVPRVTDDGVRALAALRKLKFLTLTGSRITDKSLVVIGGFRQLTRLELHGGRMSDRGLAHLAGLSSLRSLGLGGGTGHVTDKGMESLAPLTNLEEVDLSGGDVSSKGVHCLSGLKRLRVLNLSHNSQIGDIGMQALAQLRNLEDLNLRGTTVTSAGLVALRRLTRLRSLDLSENVQIDDAGIASLPTLLNLEVLDLHNTSVTAGGLQSLHTLRKLWMLDLSGNKLGTGGVDLRPLAALSSVNLAATGLDTRLVQTALDTCLVTGSRAMGGTWPGAEEMDDYYRVITEVKAVTRGPAEDKEYGTLRARVLRQRLLVRTLGRMIAMCKNGTMPRELEEQRTVVEAFTRRIAELPDVSRKGRFREFVDFLAVMDSNDPLRRLYAAASDFVFADVIDGYLQYLDRQLQKGPLTDVERDEWVEGRESLPTCLRDAAGQLSPETQDQADEPSEQIRRIWQQTRPGQPHDEASRGQVPVERKTR